MSHLRPPGRSKGRLSLSHLSSFRGPPHTVDPPCIRSKREYQSIVKDAGGSFVCVGEPEKAPDVVEFEIGQNGPRLLTRVTKAAVVTGSGAVGRQPLPHG